ncbi:hypothetical protein ASC64_09560 [Nocardioides sp. Root122]|nr:hypothetical protein ASC64_09560 [Nocardioides sp. Root122]
MADILPEGRGRRQRRAVDVRAVRAGRTVPARRRLHRVVHRTGSPVHASGAACTDSDGRLWDWRSVLVVPVRQS